MNNYTRIDYRPVMKYIISILLCKYCLDLWCVYVVHYPIVNPITTTILKMIPTMHHGPHVGEFPTGSGSDLSISKSIV